MRSGTCFAHIILSWVAFVLASVQVEVTDEGTTQKYYQNYSFTLLLIFYQHLSWQLPCWIAGIYLIKYIRGIIGQWSLYTAHIWRVYFISNHYHVQILKVPEPWPMTFHGYQFSLRERSLRTASNCLTEILGCLRQFYLVRTTVMNWMD